MNNIFDSLFTGFDMYRSWVIPEMYPNERRARIENWSKDDLEMYCGIYSEPQDPDPFGVEAARRFHESRGLFYDPDTVIEVP